MKRSEMASTAPTNSYWVTSSTRLISYTPLRPSRSPWWTESTRTKPGWPSGRGLRRSPIATADGRVRVHTVRRLRYVRDLRRLYRWPLEMRARRS